MPNPWSLVNYQNKGKTFFKGLFFMGKAIKNSNTRDFFEVLTRKSEGSQLDGDPLSIKLSSAKGKNTKTTYLSASPNGKKTSPSMFQVCVGKILQPCFVKT